jgi:EAL domain-containing protein (putative c-di-GMP-specific phosphodiesterase class I)
MTAPPDIGIDGAPELRFQPAVDIATGRLLGFEALLRWNDPIRGVLAPGVILSWAEANDHMAALNAWILFEACSRAVDWGSSLQVAVNCPASELQKRKATLAVTFALEQSGLNPDRLTVEVAEVSLCDKVAIGELCSLSSLGVQLAVDNVGPNWTGVDQPQHFAINTIKVGRSLIADIDGADGVSRTIVERLIGACHSRGVCLVAGGIETDRQEAVVRELGVQVGQGYFFAPPLCADDTRSLTAASNRVVLPAPPSVREGRPLGAPSEMALVLTLDTLELDDNIPYDAIVGEQAALRAAVNLDGTRTSRRRYRMPASFRRGRHAST